MHGLDLLRGIRAARPALPVVMLTARDEPEALPACVDAGATRFVTKPLVFADLRDALGSCAPAG